MRTNTLSLTDTFSAKNKQTSELRRHVDARINALSEIPMVAWNFGPDSGYNPSFWANTYVTLNNAAAAVSDMFSQQNGGMYTRGCHWSDMMVLLKGILDTVGTTAFNGAVGGGGQQLVTRAFSAGILRERDSGYTQQEGQSPQEWIPGDVGYVSGNNSVNLYRGEWVMYVGGDYADFWGFGIGMGSIYDIINQVKAWRQDQTIPVIVKPKRQYPGVGLQ